MSTDDGLASPLASPSSSFDTGTSPRSAKRISVLYRRTVNMSEGEGGENASPIKLSDLMSRFDQTSISNSSSSTTQPANRVTRVKSILDTLEKKEDLTPKDIRYFYFYFYLYHQILLSSSSLTGSFLSLSLSLSLLFLFLF